jgi:hypothetical protein
MLTHQCPNGVTKEKLTPFLTLFTPASRDHSDQLDDLIEKNREYFLNEVQKCGGIVFRGFTPIKIDEFDGFVQGTLKLEAFNTFNSKGTPAFMANWLRTWSEKILGAGDYRRYLGKTTVRLGPVENSIQGPHVEGGGLVQRSRLLTLCCFEPGLERAETGIADFSSVYKRLPSELQEKLKYGWNQYSYTTAHPLGLLDRLILKISPLSVEMKKDGYAILTGKLCPASCLVPGTDDISIQPWSFARNANPQVHRAAKEIFNDRGDFTQDSTADALNMNWDLTDSEGNSIGWSEEEQYTLFKTIFREAHLMDWNKGDIAIIDNVRLGHWRMNGVQGNRQLVQIQANPFDALDHRVPEEVVSEEALA